MQPNWHGHVCHEGEHQQSASLNRARWQLPPGLPHFESPVHAFHNDLNELMTQIPKFYAATIEQFSIAPSFRAWLFVIVTFALSSRTAMAISHNSSNTHATACTLRFQLHSKSCSTRVLGSPALELFGTSALLTFVSADMHYLAPPT